MGAQGGEARASCPRSGAPAPAPGAASPKADGLSFPGNLKGHRCPRLASQTSAAGDQTGCRQGADLTEETSGESAWTEVLGEGAGEPASDVRAGGGKARHCRGHWVSVGKMLLSLKEGGVGGGPGSGRHHGTA